MRLAAHVGLGVGAAVAAFLLAPLVISDRPMPRSEPITLTENTLDPSIWGKRFPVQFEAYRRPAAEDHRWREKRGHAYSLKDRDETPPDDDPRWQRMFAEIPKPRPLPGGCLECHAATGFRGPEPYYVARLRIERPVACIDCHEPRTMHLRATRGGAKRDGSPQEMRSLVCAQCHVEYYFAPGGKLVLNPGMKTEQIEAYYDAIHFSDWTHPGTGAPLLRAQHPQYELWSQGIHARSGVACADCHMPYMRQGAIKISDHHVRSPLENIERACLPCHAFPAEEMRARAKLIQDRTTALRSRALDALVALIDEIQAARAAGITDQKLEPARKLHRQAQWRADFVSEDRSKGFHAPQETARILSEAIDLARQGQLSAARAQLSP
jgi:nitrite reductase (cytochrome c-552)